jgi:lipid-A-disaccharide synthase
VSESGSALSFALPPPADGPVDLLVVAGEHSGDEHAARLVRALRTRRPGVRVAALGGPGLAAAGAHLLHDLTATSVVGFVEVLKHYAFFRTLFAATLRWIGEHRPRAVCLVDYPGFNLRLAAALRERGLTTKGGGRIRALYYISPQIWAWKARRRFAMARDLDALAVIFPFEPKFYADTALPVEFVGHPFLAADYAPPVRHDPAGPVLLLPGSRRQAVARIFPALLAGFAEHRKAAPDLRAVVLFPSEEIAAVLGAERARSPELAGAVELRANAGTTAACAVLTSSGTMSLHCALAGIPGAVAYRTNPITYGFARWWVDVPFIGMANLLLGEAMYPEFIQGAATPAALAGELRGCLGDAARRERTAAQAGRLRELLHGPGDGTAAEWLLRQTGWSAG